MSQTSMELVLNCADSQAHERKVRESAFILERVANYGRGIGLLTLDDISRNNHPNWQWDDYAI